MAVVLPPPGAASGNLDITDFLSNLSRTNKECSPGISAHVSRKSDAILMHFTNMDEPDLAELAQKLNMSTHVLRSAQALTKEMESMQSEFLNEYKEKLHDKHSARRTSWGKFHVLDCVCEHISEAIQQEAVERTAAGDVVTVDMRRMIRDEMLSSVAQKLLANNHKRNKAYMTKRQVEEARRDNAARVIQRNWRNFQVLRSARDEVAHLRRSAADAVEHGMVKEARASDLRKQRSTYRRNRRKDKFIGGLQPLDVDLGLKYPEDPDIKTPNRTMEDVETLLLTGLQRCLSSKIEDLVVEDEKSEDVSSKASPEEHATRKTNPVWKREPQKLLKPSKPKALPKLSERLEQLSKPQNRRFRNKALLVAAVSSHPSTSSMHNSSPASCLQESSYCLDSEASYQPEEEFHEMAAESQVLAGSGIRSAWGAEDAEKDTSRDINIEPAQSNTAKGESIWDASSMPLSAHVDLRKARLNEMYTSKMTSLIGRGRRNTFAGQAKSVQPPLAPGHHARRSDPVHRSRTPDAMLVSGGGGFSQRQGRSGTSGFHPQARHQRVSAALQSSPGQVSRRPQTSSGNYALEAARGRSRPEVGRAKTPMASRRRNPVSESAPAAIGSSPNNVFQVSFADVRRRRMSLPSV